MWRQTLPQRPWRRSVLALFPRSVQCDCSVPAKKTAPPVFQVVMVVVGVVGVVLGVVMTVERR